MVDTVESGAYEELGFLIRFTFSVLGRTGLEVQFVNCRPKPLKLTIVEYKSAFLQDVIACPLN
ncbi:MAG: hypothetical protein KDB32_02255 [Planctomycetes bacterium]|nr:hypothetical protein [Planctomycetota bacterium]